MKERHQVCELSCGCGSKPDELRESWQQHHEGNELEMYGDHRRSKPEESVEEHRCQPDHQPVHDAVDEMAQWRSAGLTPLLCADQG